MRSLFAFFVIFLTFFVVSTSRVLAATTPSFPSCLNPSGIVKVHYDAGQHGIVGQVSLVSGADTVYQISADALTQCFCSTDGAGIQTNWWKVSSLSDDELAQLKVDGWTLIPDGSLWGLDPAPYMAKNENFSCKGSEGKGGGDGGSSSSGSSSSSSGGSIVTQAVLGLAFTGNIILLYGVFGLGLVLVLVGLLLRKGHK